MASIPNSPKPYRYSVRLAGYDYSGGVYFVTVCTADRKCILGRIENGRMVLSHFGTIVNQHWLDLPNHSENILLDRYVIMPNHIHAILKVVRSAGIAGYAPTPDSDLPLPQRGSLSAIMRSFKSAVTNNIHKIGKLKFKSFWQRGYFEHVIKGEGELGKIRQYIVDNPARWAIDKENPAKIIKKI